MFDFTIETHSVLIYADQAFSRKCREQYPLRAKTADGYLRYAKTHIVGVIDSSATEQNVEEILGIRPDVMLYQSLDHYLQRNPSHIPDIFMIGIAPSGGEMSGELKNVIKLAISHGMHIMSGMHYELNQDSELKELACKHQVTMWDVRVPPEGLAVASCKAYVMKKPIILTCAADAAIGKMTVGFEIERLLSQKGIKGELLATGQTAIMIKGKGISIDRVIGDFMPGAVEQLVLEADPDNRFLVIEGQGGIFHPGYAPVSLALLHGGMPSHAILIQRPQRRHSIGSKLIKLPAPQVMITKYKEMALPIRIPEFIGIAVNSNGMPEQEAKEIMKQYTDETGLPVEDMIRFPTGEIARAVEKIVLENTL